jgi:glyoxylase-like metal-dependent hydrolase (beta-lactamase superfamily II)
MPYSKATLDQSTEMQPVAGSVELAMPAGALWEVFNRANRWPRWNRCMYWAANRELAAGRNLVWAFEPLRRFYLYKLPGIARLIEVEPCERVTWEVSALPGLYAHHTYFIEDLGNGRCRFGSWEKAMGPTFRLFKPFWLAHFEFVKDRSLQGARLLECLYRQHGRLDETVLTRQGIFNRLREWTASASILNLQYVALAPGVYAALGGGGNSLIVADGAEALLVDTKMPPFSWPLKRWLGRKLQVPVTTVANTHFHFDHTYGNVHYPGARLVAHANAPALMRQRDGFWWRRYPGGIPRPGDLVTEQQVIKVGDQEVVVNAGEQGHTAGDVWLYLQRDDTEIIATGDVASLGIYPFLDPAEGGADLLNMVRRLRAWAHDFPRAVFVPGHGPVATAADLLQHAHYLQFLYDSVAAARTGGMSRDEAARHIDLKQFGLMVVPIFHYGHTFLSEAGNVSAAYQLQMA